MNGASSTSGNDVLLAKYTDNGTSATLGWTQVGGGTGTDVGQAVAVSGTSVYVTGNLTNSTTNTQGVLFGGGGTTAGTTQVNGASTNGASDVLLAKYTDQGATATLGWTQVGGGTGNDVGYGVAASNTSVYVTGIISNNTANANGVVFGGNGTTAGTTQVNGATSTASDDVLLAKYTGQGATATLRWTQVGGGTDQELSNGVAVSGTSVYVTGYITNSTTNTQGVLFGGTGTTAGTVQVNGANPSSGPDVVLAKYTDQGGSATLGWTQVGGGSGFDQGRGVAVSGTSVYVAGLLNNNAANGQAVVFGGGGTTAGTLPVNGATSTVSIDLLLAKYTDNGSSATFNWGQTGGGTSTDFGNGVAVSGQQVYAAGAAVPTATFGPTTLTTPVGTQQGVLARATDTTLPLPVQLVQFTATAAGPAAMQLTWATASEANSAYFAVERSPDGRAWVKLGEVAAAGNSLTPRTYAWLDGAPLAGTSYYRLRQVDQDGTAATSPVRAVALGSGAGLALWPNPATGRTTLSGTGPGTLVQVLNVLGSVVLATTADGAGTAALPLPAGLAPGVYVVRTVVGATRLVVE